MDLKKYPPDWKEISRRVRERSGGRCECEGECGHHNRRCWKINGKMYPKNVDATTATEYTYPVVLTVAHLDHDRGSDDESRMRAMCQACHLRYDAPRKRAERIRKANEGQLVMEIEG